MHFPNTAVRTATAMAFAPLGLIIVPAPASAQVIEPDPVPAEAGTLADPGVSPAPADALPEADGDIVVRAPSAGRGAARVKADYEIGSAEIELNASDTIDELMESLSTRTGSSQPIILVNGERVPGGGGIGSYPPEAIEKIQVLPAEAAAAYGYPPGQQLVNIVLKRNFANWTAQGDAGGPTRGGSGQYGLSLSRVVIAGNKRISFGARASSSTMLLESERDIPSEPSPYGYSGNIRSPISGAEIDPALSDLAGKTVVTSAAPGDWTGTPALGDFLAGANEPRLAGQSRYRSLAPETRSLGLNAALARPLGKFQSTAQLSLDVRESASLQGLPVASLSLAPDSGYSPFEGEVLIDRAWHDPLRSSQQSLSFNGNAGVQGEVSGWQIGAGAGYSYSRSTSNIDRGADVAAMQAVVDGGIANPFTLSLIEQAGEYSRTLGHILSLNVNAAKSVARLPAGAVRLSFGSEASSGWADTSFKDDRADFHQRDQSVSGRLALIVPVNSRTKGPIAPLGGLTLQLSAGGDAAKGAALRHQYSYGLSWEPIPGIDFSATVARATRPPDNGLLSAPLTETPGVRLYDFAAGERVEVVRVDGGNPGLEASTSSSLNLRLSARPAFLEGLSFLGEYSRSDTRDGIGQLPALTAALEQAFPERVTRGPGGELLRIDARPINIASAFNESVKSYISLMLPLGTTPKAAREGAGQDDGDEYSDRPRGRSGGKKGAANLMLSLAHDWNISDRVVFRRGLSPLDRLAGEGGTSAPKHSVSGSAKLNIKGMGLGIDARWIAPTLARSDGLDGGLPTRLDFSSKTEVGLRLFGSASKIADGDWAKGLRLGLDVDNLFDSRVKVTDQGGNVPLGFTRDELDPLGRTVKFSVRKLL